jgi:hypothetical protein
MAQSALDARGCPPLGRVAADSVPDSCPERRLSYGCMGSFSLFYVGALKIGATAIIGLLLARMHAHQQVRDEG